MDVRSFDGAVIARNPNLLNRKNQSEVTLASSDVSFSGNAPVESNSGKFLKSAFIAGLSIAPFAAAPGLVNAQDAPQPAPQVFTDVAPNGARIPFVNNAKDLPQLRPTIKQDVVDLMNNPLLSPAAKHDIEKMIQDLRAKGVGQMSVVVIPNTQNRELNTLSTDIFNQMGIGEKGKNNGVLILVNANNMRENKSPRMNINPGIGFEKTLSQTVTADIMLKHAAPHMKNKDYDGAVRDVVKAVKEYLEANQPKTGVTGADGGSGSNASTVSDPNAAGTGAEVILTLLAALAVTAGGVGAGVYLHNRKKKFEEAAAIVTKPLNEMESGYKVTRANIYTAKTVEALLTTDRIRPNQHSLLSALELVEANLPPTEEATLTQTYIDKGISHASPEIRIHFINRLSKKDVASSDVDRSVLSALLAQLELEKEPKVINALGTPIIAMAGAQQVPLFESKLSNPEPAIRQLSLGILKKFATIETPPKFFALIETEKDNNLVELLQVYLTQLATPELRNLYLDKLTKTPAGEKQQAIHKAAIQGLGKIANPSDFPALFEGFKKDSALYLDKSYQEALEATVNKSQINVIQTGLDHPEPRVQLTSLALLAKFPSPFLVAPLFTYYEKVAAENNEKLASKAEALLKKSVDASNRVLLLNKLDASSTGVKRLALQGLTQVAKSEDVPKLFAVLATPDGPALAEDVQEVLNHAVDSSQRNFLESNFTAASSEVRYAAAVGFKKIAISQDLVKALKAYQAESTPKVEQAFAQLVGDVSGEKENFKPLSQFLTAEKTMNKARVLVAEDIVAHGTKALNPLFQALSEVTPEERVLTAQLKSSIEKLSNDPKALDILLENVDTFNPTVETIATNSVVKILETWSNESTFDDSAVMSRLDELSNHDKPAIKGMAKQVQNNLVTKKAHAVSEFGNSGDFHSSSSYSQMDQLQNNKYAAIREAATQAKSRLNQRRSDWEYQEEQRRIREAEEARLAAIAAAAAAAAAAEAAARRRREEAEESSRRSSESSSSSWGSSSSSSSSDWGSSSSSGGDYGGGMSSGGGSDW